MKPTPKINPEDATRYAYLDGSQVREFDTENTHTAKFIERNASHCRDAGTLTEATTDAFNLLAATWGRLCAARENGAGVHEIVCLTKQVSALMVQFGMTPASRKKLGITDTTEADDDF